MMMNMRSARQGRLGGGKHAYLYVRVPISFSGATYAQTFSIDIGVDMGREFATSEKSRPHTAEFACHTVVLLRRYFCMPYLLPEWVKWV